MLKVNSVSDLNAQSLMDAMLKEKLMRAKASHGMSVSMTLLLRVRAMLCSGSRALHTQDQ